MAAGGLIREHGPVDDEPCEHPSPRDADAVAIVRDHRAWGSAGLALCPYHLTLWNDINPGVADDAGVADLLLEDAPVELTDAPEFVGYDGLSHRRLGIDHAGAVHLAYFRGDRFSVVLTDATGEVDDRPVDSHDGSRESLETYLRYVSGERGWMLVDDDTLDAYTVTGLDDTARGWIRGP